MQYKDIAIFIAGVITSALFWIYKYNDPVPFFVVIYCSNNYSLTYLYYHYQRNRS